MKSRSDIFLDKALSYKNEREKLPWWRFKKRLELKRKINSALDLVLKYDES